VSLAIGTAEGVDEADVISRQVQLRRRPSSPPSAAGGASLSPSAVDMKGEKNANLAFGESCSSLHLRALFREGVGFFFLPRVR